MPAARCGYIDKWRGAADVMLPAGPGPPAVAGTLPLVSRATSPAGSIHSAARNIEYGIPL